MGDEVTGANSVISVSTTMLEYWPTASGPIMAAIMYWSSLM